MSQEIEPGNKHASSSLKRLRVALRSLIPAALGGDGEERIRACAGSLLGILLTALISHKVLGAQASLWLIAPMGASAVLLFAVPSSPLAQPWSIMGGNFVAAVVGVSCWYTLRDHAAGGERGHCASPLAACWYCVACIHRQVPWRLLQCSAARQFMTLA